MTRRGQLPQRAGAMHQYIQPSKTPIDAGAEDIDLLALPQIQRQQRRRTAGGADGVVGFLQPALRAGGYHQMRPQPRQRDGGRGANTPAGACHQCHRPF